MVNVAAGNHAAAFGLIAGVIALSSVLPITSNRHDAKDQRD
jgi:hypothetical protein